MSEPASRARTKSRRLTYIYTAPALPSIKRWRTIYRNGKKLSCLRALEYERLAEINIQGPVLDVGGGKKSLYRDLLPKGLDYESVNIDPSIEPTFLLHPSDSFPMEDATYQTCLCLNTLEHIYDARFVIDEIHRVLKPGGVVHITVPFIFRIHGHPDDYFRGTPSWWRETLVRSGFTTIQLYPLVWGRYTSAGSISGYRGIFRRSRFHLSHMFDLLYSKLTFIGGDGRYSGRRGERICDVALGYFISAQK